MNHIMRDGTVVDDPRLGRLKEFDAQSLLYPVVELPRLASRAPRSYSWRCWEWFDQGQEGACVAFSIGHELAARPSEIIGWTNSLLQDAYLQIQREDPWPGGSYPGASPRYEGTSVLSGIKYFQRSGYFTEYRWAFSLDDLIMAVAWAGPAVIGVNWYSGMFAPNSNGFLSVSGFVSGGHAICVRAVRLDRRVPGGGYFILRNSWGKNWGVDGDCYVTFEDMKRLLSEDGEAVIPSGRKTARRRAA